MTSSPEWMAATNVLCIRLDSLGDVLMTSPAIRALKETQPHRTITLLTSHAGAQAAALVEQVDRILVYDAPWMKATAHSNAAAKDLDLVRRLKDMALDAAVIFTTFSQSPLPAALLAFLAEIPLRLAYCHENPYQLLTNWLPETDHSGGFESRHEVRRQLDLVAAVGCRTAQESISLRIRPEAVDRIHSVLRAVGLDARRPWLIMHPGGSAPSRRYPAQGFAAAAQELAVRHHLQVLFTGSQPEAELVEEIRRGMRADSFSLAGRLSVEELSAAISIAPLLVSNNTGPVHIAAGVQTPVVDLYALTNPQHTPWMLEHRLLYHDVPCQFCYKSICPMGHHNCLRLVPPHAVVEAALDLLGTGRRAA